MARGALLLPKDVLRTTLGPDNQGTPVLAVFLKKGVKQWPDGPSVDDIKGRIAGRARGVKEIHDVMVVVNNCHVLFKVTFQPGTTMQQAKQYAFVIDQLMKESIELRVGSLQVLKRRPNVPMKALQSASQRA